MTEAYTTSLTALEDTDVLVVGSGSAGATAAIAAARMGVRTTLVERYGFCGGISTQVLDTFYGFYTPGRTPRKVVGGIADEVVGELTRRGVAFERPNTYGAGTGITYNPEVLKVVWETLARRAGVRLLYHTLCVDVVREGRAIRRAVLVNRGGFFSLRARVVVDASGDGDLAARAGAPVEQEAPERLQAMTTTFRLANVDVERASRVSRQEFLAHIAAAAGSGYRLPRREGSVHRTPEPGVVAANMTRVQGLDPTDPVQLTEAEVEGRAQALEYVRFLRDRIPGYEDARLIWLSTQIGIRESRRIVGEYRLTRDDVLGARRFEDAIAQCGAPIEEHVGRETRWVYLSEGETVDIPYRTLLPRGVDCLLVAGRCFSADHDAHAAVRSMAQCMAMGHAAGVAAALCVERRCGPGDLPVRLLQAALRAQGARLAGAAPLRR
jgi:glycine/D-amino acid oxidase-like deaminating enzyme